MTSEVALTEDPTRHETAPPRTFALSAYWLTSPHLSAVLDAVERAGPVRVVGGAVRNRLIGEPIGDIDLATEAEPAEVARAAGAAGLRVHETGLEHGTLTLVADGSAYEVTTLREDVSTDGRRATVRFTTDWARDAARRDFTMNALYVDRRGLGTDYVGGYADCLARRVRFIGDADRRIVEDHLRILRFFRFSAAYGRGSLDADGLAAVRRHKDRIAELAVERVSHELMRTVTAPHAAAVLDLIGSEGFLAPLMPGPFHVAGYRALAEVERRIGRAPTPVLAIAALVGFDPSAYASSADALRFSRRDRARGLAALDAAAKMPPRSVPQSHALLYDHGAEAFGDGVLLAAAKGVEMIDLRRLMAEALRWRKPRLPVSGHDLLEQSGEAGPQLGARLTRLETAWRQSDFSLDRAHLLAIDRRSLKDRPHGGEL